MLNTFSAFRAIFTSWIWIFCADPHRSCWHNAKTILNTVPDNGLVDRRRMVLSGTEEAGGLLPAGLSGRWLGGCHHAATHNSGNISVMLSKDFGSSPDPSVPDPGVWIRGFPSEDPRILTRFSPKTELWEKLPPLKIGYRKSSRMVGLAGYRNQYLLHEYIE